jgi:rubrerythrin
MIRISLANNTHYLS